MKDLLGHEITIEEARKIERAGKKKRKQTQPKGYAARPGSGPAGENCKTCDHACHVNGGTRNFWKCDIIQHRWTHGPGTDIRLKSPACSFWKSKLTPPPAIDKNTPVI